MLKNITLRNFRNFEKKNITFNKNINIIYGFNGSGKTSILESIFFLLNLKSFQTKSKKNLINYNQKHFHITGLFFDNNQIDLIFNTNNITKYFFNKILLNTNDNYSLFKENINIISFIPKDLEIITGYSNLRRNYIDYNIFQINKDYIKYLKKYNKYLLIKNKLLKTLKNSNKFKQISNILDKKIALLASKIIYERITYINNINKYILKIISKLEIQFNFELLHKNPFFNCNINKVNIYTLEQLLLQKIILFHDKEIFYGNALIGSHKDDIMFLINKKNIKNFASRGQIKICILVLQLAHYEYLSNIHNNQKNILILDDVFNEIDDNNQILILKQLQKYNQVIISSCNKPVINNNDKINYININNKNIVSD